MLRLSSDGFSTSMPSPKPASRKAASSTLSMATRACRQPSAAGSAEVTGSSMSAPTQPMCCIAAGSTPWSGNAALDAPLDSSAAQLQVAWRHHRKVSPCVLASSRSLCSRRHACPSLRKYRPSSTGRGANAATIRELSASSSRAIACAYRRSVGCAASSGSERQFRSAQSASWRKKREAR